LTKPEERLAQRLLARHKITKPPYDLVALVQNYATVEYIEFPTDADGLVVGISSMKKPGILVNSKLHGNRKKFTLAHELGHVIIPWHTGTIISHTDAESDPNLEWEYRTIEGEANRFAAELLMPSKWLNNYYASKQEIQNLILKTLELCETSLDSALIKIFNSITEPVICFELYGVNQISKTFLTKSSPKRRYDNGDVLDENPFTIPARISSFQVNGRRFKAWEFEFDALPIIEETDPRQWREILEDILNEANSQNLKASINATLASAFQRNKHLEKQKIYSEILKSFNGRNDLVKIVTSPLFSEYVIKRVNELLLRNSK